MKPFLLVSALALSTIASVALAEPPALAEPLTLTNAQLGSISAGRRVEDTQYFLGASDNEVKEGQKITAGRTKVTTLSNPANPDNTNCNLCGPLPPEEPRK